MVFTSSIRIALVIRMSMHACAAIWLCRPFVPRKIDILLRKYDGQARKNIANNFHHSHNYWAQPLLNDANLLPVVYWSARTRSQTLLSLFMFLSFASNLIFSISAVSAVCWTIATHDSLLFFLRWLSLLAKRDCSLHSKTRVIHFWETSRQKRDKK